MPALDERCLSFPDVFAGAELDEDELNAIRRYLESLDHIDEITDELRALVVRNWPHLVPKLPPKND
jgi:hypothetical protein